MRYQELQDYWFAALSVMPRRALSRHQQEIVELRRLARHAGLLFVVQSERVAVRRGEREIRISANNYIYAYDLIQNFDYYFDAVKPQSESSLLVVDYSKPALHTMQDGLEFWFPELPEPMETTLVYLQRAKLSSGLTVFDLGAYAGAATYHFSRAVGPTGRVYAFEPDPRNFACLERNIALHELDNVVPDRAGVWSKTGRVMFQAEGNMGSAVEDAADRDSDTKQWIDVVSLPDFCARRHIERVDFVKMDVEGSEVAILDSAGDFLAHYRPSIIVEPHRVKGVRTDSDISRILAFHGYVVEVLEQAGLEFPLLFASPK